MTILNRLGTWGRRLKAAHGFFPQVPSPISQVPYPPPHIPEFPCRSCLSKTRRNTPNGFSLLEIMVVLAIIGLFVTISAGALRDTTDDAEVISALSQMDSIRQAVIDGFYKDFGCIPEEVHGKISGVGNNPEYRKNPEYATRFLCLQRDCGDSEFKIKTFIDEYTKDSDSKWSGFNDDDFCPGCCFMFNCLENLFSERLGKNLKNYIPLLMTNPVYGFQSWTGPYLEANSQFNATALNQSDDTRYPADFYSDSSTFEDDPVILPVISTPWADGLEASALEIEADDPSYAAQLRKGKYYQILVYSRDAGDDSSLWIQVPETAVVISRGPDGMPGSEGDDGTVGAEDYWTECADMNDGDLTAGQRQCFERLMITDPDDPEYVDIGDDMVLFIFGGGTVRSSLDN